MFWHSSRPPTTGGPGRFSNWYVQNSVNGPYGKSNLTVSLSWVEKNEEKPHVGEQWKFEQPALENRTGRNVKRRGHYGRHQRRAGGHRGKGWCGFGHGFGARPSADSRRGRRGAHGFSEKDSRDHGSSFDSCDGQMSHRTFCRGADSS